MRTIHAKDLRQAMEQSKDLLLINVLEEHDFETRHIPGSRNVPHESPKFVEQVSSLAGSKSRPIVVYCASKSCSASPTAAKKLEQAGFTNVTDFEGGVEEWKQAGFTLEGRTPAPTH